MSRDLHKHVQILLLIAFAVAGIRIAFIWYQRRAASRPQQSAEIVRFPDDYYITPKKLYAYDVPSARKELTQQPVWARDGYRFAYHAFNSRTHRADFRRQSGLLGPIEKLQITDVVLDHLPGNSSQKQVLAIFSKDGRDYAVSIGSESAGDYNIVPDMFFLQDPHELYKHWSSRTWQSIERHEVQMGMNEFQAAFAIGMGIPQAGDIGSRTIQYPNNGHPVQITFEEGHAVAITGPQS